MNSTKKVILMILLVDIVVMGVIFSVSGLRNTGVDTADYVKQIEYYGGIMTTDAVIDRWAFKPLYGILGSVLTPTVEPETAMLLLNISFFVGLSVFFFLFLVLFGFPSEYAIIGTLWLISGYPLLKYGLALGTDVSGWFFAVLGAYLGLLGLQTGRLRFLVLASVVGFVGFLAKETGILGLGAAGLAVLFSFRRSESGLFIRRLLSISVPFLVLESLYVLYLVLRGSRTFLDWYQINVEGIHSYQTLRYLIGIEGASFHVLALIASIGLVFAIINGEIISKLWLSKFLPLFIVSLPVLAWPIYITRILYVQFLFVIPLALYGLEKMSQRVSYGRRSLFLAITASIPIIVSLGLFWVGHDRSLFDLISL